jgi:hypothetical protein
VPSAARLLLLCIVMLPASLPGPSAGEPPDVPATARLVDRHIVLTYGRARLFEGTVESPGATPDLRRFVETAGGRVTQVVKWTAAPGTRLTLTGTVHASTEAFGAAVEPREEKA